jgi:hypothetical protein
MEGAFNPIAQAIQIPIRSPAPAFTRGMIANYRDHSAVTNSLYEGTGVVASISNYSACRLMRKQSLRFGHFVAVALRERNVDWLTLQIDDGVEFC